jgi:hypothetical protein
MVELVGLGMGTTEFPVLPRIRVGVLACDAKAMGDCAT